MSHEIYSRAVDELVQSIGGGLADRDQIKIVQLFDRLLAEGYSIHMDDLRRLCRDKGYDEPTADRIGFLYDSLYLIRHELENPSTIDYWPLGIMEDIIGRQSRSMECPGQSNAGGEAQ